jgi:hypothetical protein
LPTETSEISAEHKRAVQQHTVEGGVLGADEGVLLARGEQERKVAHDRLDCRLGLEKCNEKGLG